jgi:hypothetical protein
MVTRRGVLGATTLALAGGTAGCLDAVPFLGNSPIEFEAAPASVPASALQSNGYREFRTEEMVIERTLEAAGQEQTVIVTNQQSEYDRGVSLGPTDQRVRAAVFTVLSTPKVNVLGRSFNPVAEMSPAEIAGRVQGRFEGMENLQRVGETTTALAGTEATVTEFETEAQLAESGVTTDVALHISEAVESGEDLLVAVGGYPRALGAGERDRVFALMDAVEHG